MNFQTRFAFLLGAITVSFLLASAAYAQVLLPSPGPCTATECPLGIQSNTRGQIGNGLPLPITARPGQTGVITNANDRVLPCFHPAFVAAAENIVGMGNAPNGFCQPPFAPPEAAISSRLSVMQTAGLPALNAADPDFEAVPDRSGSS